jgi:transposase InsO family protein
MVVRGFTPRCVAKASAAAANGSHGSCGRRGCVATRPRRRKPRTTDSQHARPVAPNLLARNFTATAPNRKWVADITAIATRSGWLYLAGILDVYSRRAIGYAMDTTRDEHLVEEALDMALASRRPARVHLKGWVSEFIFDEQTFSAVGNDVRLQSPGYDTADRRYDIEVSSSASMVTIIAR